MMKLLLSCSALITLAYGLCSTEAPNTFCMEVDLFAGMTGLYRINGMESVSPELHVRVGETYVFDQTHVSNWMHAVGFAYYPDGAHGLTWGGEEKDEVDGAGELQYLINGEAPTCDDAGSTGLDCYEPEFFLPREEWKQRTYTAHLTITQQMADQSFNGTLYYFCHIHSKMSGKLRILNADGSLYMNRKNELQLYDPQERDPFDVTCGTTGIAPYAPGARDACETNYVANHPLTELDTDFEKCFQAIDCAMHKQMRVEGFDSHKDQLATFMQMMVPHHWNAINMAKIMLKLASSELKAETSEDFESIMWAIAASQGYEIHQFMNYLGSSVPYLNTLVNGAPLQADKFGPHCNDTFESEPSSIVTSTDESEDGQVGAWGGCTPSATTFCARVNLHIGDAGYYQFADHNGNSPDIEVKIGETYVFDQTDATNWFHPLGFAYYPDGAHGQDWGGSEQDEVESTGELLYKIDGAKTSCPEAGNTGLDCYEPEFFHPRAAWMQKRYTVELTITQEMADKSNNGVLYYFCHIHSKMSGKIVIKNVDGTAYTNSKGEAELYVPTVAGPQDRACGTMGVDAYMFGGPKSCDTRFLCGHLDTNFEKCMHAINCKMMQEMRAATTPNCRNKLEVFMQQMIPHHVNAVNMGRIMLKFAGPELAKPGMEDLRNIMHAVINSQNYQIHVFRNYLGGTEGATLNEAALPARPYLSTQASTTIENELYEMDASHQLWPGAALVTLLLRLLSDQF